MLAPPETFQQLRALAWAAPMLAALAVGGAALASGCFGPVVVSVLALACGVGAWLGAMAGIWVSAHGVRHNRVAVALVFVLVALPLAWLLLPALSPDRPGLLMPFMLATALGHAALLSLAACWHARQAPLSGQEAGARRLEWPGCRVDLARMHITKVDRPAGAAEQWVPPAAIGVAAVAGYHAIKAALPADALAIGGLLVANAMVAWLSLGPLGRALGQSWQLRRLERRLGRRFVSGRLDWLTRERQRFALGRWMHRAFNATP